MDLHEIPGASAHELAEAHKKDLELQDEFGVKMLTYWYDSERGTAFCLVDAPAEDPIRQLHDHAHGNVPHQIIPVDIMAVRSFLGRISDPLPENIGRVGAGISEVDAAFRIIMFTDLKDSTAMTSRLGEDKAIALLELHNRMIRRCLRQHKGSEVKHTGDGFMASFASSRDSVLSAIAIQQAFAAHNSGRPDETMYVRIGLHGGEPIERSGDLFGSAIQMAARLCSQCEPGQILASDVVRSSSKDHDLPFVDMGQIEMKGFEAPVKVYMIRWEK
jgi:class 3 adenylate cyclase